MFALFVESGVERKVECRVVEDDTHIELSVMMPLPPDELLSFAGFKAVAANLSPCNETFLIAAPAKLRKESRSLMHYPNDSLPLWNVFRYQLEELSYDPGLESEFHMQEAFAKLAAKRPRPTEKNDTPRSGAISENNSAPSKQRNANESA